MVGKERVQPEEEILAAGSDFDPSELPLDTRVDLIEIMTGKDFSPQMRERLKKTLARKDAKRKISGQED